MSPAGRPLSSAFGTLNGEASWPAPGAGEFPIHTLSLHVSAALTQGLGRGVSAALALLPSPAVMPVAGGLPGGSATLPLARLARCPWAACGWAVWPFWATFSVLWASLGPGGSAERHRHPPYTTFLEAAYLPPRPLARLS